VLTDDGRYHVFFNTWGGKDGLTRRQFLAPTLHDSRQWKLVPGRIVPTAHEKQWGKAE